MILQSFVLFFIFVTLYTVFNTFFRLFYLCRINFFCLAHLGPFHQCILFSRPSIISSAMLFNFEYDFIQFTCCISVFAHCLVMCKATILQILTFFSLRSIKFIFDCFQNDSLKPKSIIIIHKMQYITTT